MASINVNGQLISLRRPLVMGILNITPDSFYEGSRVIQIDRIVEKAGEMIDDGVDVIDVGGYSSRPGADHIPLDEEIKRIKEPIRHLRKSFPDLPISIDTFRVKVAEEAINIGANIINDISGGHLDKNMYDFVGDVNVPYIGMHMKGSPQTMKELNKYEDLMKDLIFYFSAIVNELTSRGVTDIILDPGFGFAKNAAQNFEVLNKLEQLQILEKPILVGLSRKSMIYKTLKVDPDSSLNGTTALNALALYKGASVLRVHDVKEAVEVVNLVEEIKLTN